MSRKKNANILLVLFFMLALTLHSHPTFAIIVDRILATVNDEIITYADYLRFTGGIGAYDNPGDVDEQVLKDLIEDRMILSEAKKRGLEAGDEEIDMAIEEFIKGKGISREDLEKGLKEEGLTLYMYRKSTRDRIVMTKLVQAEVDSKIFIKDNEIENYYAQHRADYLITREAREVKAIFIRLREGASVTELTDLKRRALDIVSLLKSGEDFDMLVQKYSDEPLKSQGGKLGTFTRGTLISPLEEKAFRMGKNEISDPVWVSEGVYILLVVDTTDEKLKTFDGAKSEIYGILFRQKKEKLFNEWMKTLWEKTSVTINQG
ncbi:MAG: peptidylprolyl isomerase [Nitrospirota bacterium]